MKIIVNAPVNDVNRLKPFRRAHEHARVAHKQIAAFDDFNSHLPRQIGVLEIRAVVSAGREQHDCRISHTRRRDVAEGFQKLLRVMVNGLDADGFKHSGKRALHRAAVFQNVTHAGRTAAVVFEHEIISVLVADQIRAADADVNSLRHFKVHELAAEMFSRQNEKLRDDTVLQDFLLVINVVQEKIQRRDALREAALDLLPLFRRDDPRQQIKRKNFLRALRVAINVERDALPQKIRVHRLPLGVEFRARQSLEKSLKFFVVRPIDAFCIHHFVEPSVARIFFNHIKTRVVF